MLQCALRDVCTAIPGFTQNEDQDAQEMYTYIMCHISNLILDNIEISKTEICTHCRKKSIREENEGNTIRLNLRDIAVQSLLEFELRKTCKFCGNDCIHKVSKTHVNTCPKNPNSCNKEI